MEVQKHIIVEEDKSYFDIKQFWRLIKKNWKWFLYSLVVCLMFAVFYLWVTPTTVSVTGKMEIIDKTKSNSSGISTGMALLNSLPLNLGSSFGAVSSLGIDSEKEILTSNTLACNVVKDLNLYVEYRLRKLGHNTLLYQNNPITVILDTDHVQWFDAELPLYYHKIQLTVTKNSSGYKVETQLLENKEKTNLPVQTFTTLPATINTEVGSLTISENILPPRQAKAFEKDYTLIIEIKPPSKVAESFVGRIVAEPPSKSISNILKITLRDENMMRGISFINGLVEAYNQRANNMKNEEARKTDEFVNDRLAKIDLELGSSDDAWEKAKKQYQIATPEMDAEEALNKKSQYERQLVDLGTKLEIQDFLNDYINDPKNLYELIPISIAIASSSSATGAYPFIEQHNTLINQRKELLKSVSEMSPQIQRVTQSIRDLHPTIQLAMKRDREQIVMQKNTLDREYSRYAGRLGAAPQIERAFTEIGRLREIKQAVYLLLLQKREETAMNLANTTDKGRLIDDVILEPSGTKPQKKLLILVALFFGVMIPLAFIHLLQMRNTKINSCEELRSLSKFPFLVDIAESRHDRAFRNLRTKLLLLLKPGQKTILIASQNDGDGKTFIANHLMESLVAIGKKVLLVNGDLSESVKDRYPADILAGEDFAQQMAHAKAANDFVIIDSPSIGICTDALQLAQFADATLYVVKSGVTQNSDVKSLSNDNCMPFPMLVFNTITNANY